MNNNVQINYLDKVYEMYIPIEGTYKETAAKILFRIWNAIKSIFGFSDWQLARNEFSGIIFWNGFNGHISTGSPVDSGLRGNLYNSNVSSDIADLILRRYLVEKIDLEIMKKTDIEEFKKLSLKPDQNFFGIWATITRQKIASKEYRCSSVIEVIKNQTTLSSDITNPTACWSNKQYGKACTVSDPTSIRPDEYKKTACWVRAEQALTTKILIKIVY